MPLRRLSYETRELLLLAWVVAFTASGYLAYHANENRIEEIQAARVFSCQKTYDGIRDVFQPFFTPVKERTPQQRADIRKFNRTINERRAACGEQTRVDAEQPGTG